MLLVLIAFCQQLIELLSRVRGKMILVSLQLAHLDPWKVWENNNLVSNWFWDRSHKFHELNVFLKILRSEVNISLVLGTFIFRLQGDSENV